MEELKRKKNKRAISTEIHSAINFKLVRFLGIVFAGEWKRKSSEDIFGMISVWIWIKFAYKPCNVWLMVRYRDVMQGYTEEDYQYRGETNI